MKSLVRVFLLLAGLLLITCLVAPLFIRSRSEPPASPPPSVPRPVSAPSIPAPDPAASAPAATDTVAGAPAPAAAPLLNGDAAQEAITSLAVTYDAASVPALARYLSHSDPEIRAAARDGLVQLGERAAIPFLEAAAKTAPADEAKELREAAEFLALPTWTERREALKKAKSATSSAPLAQGAAPTSV